MNPRHRPVLGLLVASVTILSAFMWAGVIGDTSRHESIRAQIEELELAESRFRELLIRYRHGIAQNYDEGNLWIDRLNAAQAKLDKGVREVPDLREEWAGLHHSATELTTRWEDFKRRNAQVRNALDQFQLGLADLSRDQPERMSDGPLAGETARLNTRLLANALGHMHESSDALVGSTLRLSTMASMSPDTLRQPIERLLRYAEVIAKQAPLLDADFSSLASRESTSRLQRLNATNFELLSQEQTRATRYRIGLLLCVTILAQIMIGLAVRYFDSMRRLGEQGRFFKSVSDNVGVGVLATDMEGKITFANPLAQRLLARPGEPLTGRHMHGDGIYAQANGQPTDPAGCQICKAIRGSEIFSGEQYLLKGDGCLMPTQMTAAPLQVDDGTGSVIVFQDISERMEKERDLRLAGTVFESSHQGIVVTDATGAIVRVNPAYCHITAYREDELIGANPRITSSGMQDKAFYREMWKELTTIGRWQGEMRNRRKNGELYTQWANIDAVHTERGELLYVGIVSDITELVDTRERLATMAYFDPLTGLPNRVLFRDRLGQALMQSRREQQSLALIYADLDNFKTINDTLGHAAGDNLLVEAAHRFQSCLRESDTVARLGGDEFAMVLMDAKGPGEMAALADEIIAALSTPYQTGGYSISSGVSLGIAFWPTDGDTPEELLKHADVAMYRAKDLGRNNYQFFTGDMAASVADQMMIESGLRSAVESGELSILYQPQIAANGRAVSAEALLRWNSPELGWVLPTRFIPIAEKSGLITLLGDFALREACKMCRIWRDTIDPDMRVSVNLSALQFRDEGLVRRIAVFLHENGLPGEALELELTESVVMDDVARGLDILIALKQLGCRLAIDDFGTGYSSLAYLKRFPVDVLKIDKAFIDGLGTKADDTLVVQAIFGLASSLGMEVVAEGVETLVQMDILRSSANGTHFLAQGYYFAGPLPPSEFAKLFPHFRQLKLVAN